MSWSAFVRRVLLMAALAAAGAVAYTRLRGRSGVEPDPPEWPPFEPPPGSPPSVEPAPVESEPVEPAPVESVPAESVPVEPVDAEPAEPVPVESGPDVWVPPAPDGSAPDGYPVKVKTSSGIFHVPGGRFYDRTVPDRCYPSEAAAEADGYRRSKT